MSNTAYKTKSFRARHGLRNQLSATCYSLKQGSDWSQHLPELLNEEVTVALCSVLHTASLCSVLARSQTIGIWSYWLLMDTLADMKPKLWAAFSHLCCYCQFFSPCLLLPFHLTAVLNYQSLKIMETQKSPCVFLMDKKYADLRHMESSSASQTGKLLCFPNVQGRILILGRIMKNNKNIKQLNYKVIPLAGSG